jgi:hypothetical protein
MFNPQAPRPETSTRLLLVRHALAAAFKARRQILPAAPESLATLLEACGDGVQGLAGRQGVLGGLREIRARLFYVPGREAEAQTWWYESLAAAVFGARVAQLRGASIPAAFCGGLLHRGGEVLALKMLARVELEYRLRLDTAARRDWCTTHGYELSERLVRGWALAPQIAACVLGWMRFGEFVEASGESAALYFGRLFAVEALQPAFCVPGAIDHAAQDLGLDADVVAKVRAEEPNVRELIRALA